MKSNEWFQFLLECASGGELLVAEVTGDGLLPVGPHVRAQGLGRLEPLGAQVADHVADLGVDPGIRNSYALDMTYRLTHKVG